MYDLIIDGHKIASDEFVKPLIEQLDQYARDTGFQVAAILHVAEELVNG